MDYVPEPEHVNLESHLTRVLTANEAVQQGIATHAQKEHDRRDEARRKAEAALKLQAGMTHGG